MTTATLAREDGTTRNVLALGVLLGATAVAGFLVPLDAWGDLADPAARAAMLMVAFVATLVTLRSTGAVLWERRSLALLLAVMPLIYLERGALEGAGSWLAIEALGLAIFSVWAWLGYRRDPWVLALGLAAHGIAWDSWHHESHYIPSWYASACLIVDLGLAGYVWLQRERLRG